MYKGANNPRATKIICVETLEVFDYIQQAAEKLNIKSSVSITRALKNKSYVASGYHFVKYSDEIYDYLVNNKYEYLKECYKETGIGKYFSDDTNKIIISKTDLFNKIHAETDIKTRDIRQMLSDNIVNYNNI